MKTKLLKVSLVGRTNAGKSTLINLLVNELISISNKKINTTEDIIEGVLNIKNHQIILYDTPGINFTFDKNIRNKLLNKNIWEGINKSDIILLLIDINIINLKQIQKYLSKLLEVNKKIIVVFNKNDIETKKSLTSYIKVLKKLYDIYDFFSISCKNKKGIKNLKDFFIKNTYNSKWLYKNNEITNKDDIYISNQSTRNSILSVLHKEIPYNVIVENKYFNYLKNGDLKIKQDLIIETERYKKIILGRNGSKIKQIRTKSQNFISKILKSKVHLYINIKLRDAKKI
tara:strand:+ start:5801 stop:6658 length:858 start_codon:yes stop_codon:yes gene_type:complete